MQKTQRLFALVSILVLLASLSLAQDPKKQRKKQTVAPAAASNPVVGSGAAGQLTKWTGVEGSNTYTIGDTNITEDKFGKVGIGTRTPTSQFTVRGSIETTLGGFKFPDGTIQTTSAAGALLGVAHDSTLQGNGTTASPLGVGVPLILSGSPADAVISATNTVSGPNGLGVFGKSANGGGVFGLSTVGNGVTGQSTGGLGVNGFSSTSIGVRGSSSTNIGVSGISSTNTGVKGVGIVGVEAIGADDGQGLNAKGGNTIRDATYGGPAVLAAGGDSSVFIGGDGIRAEGGAGGTSSAGVPWFGGRGIFAIGGTGAGGSLYDGSAGSFIGDVHVEGDLNVTRTKNFKIDHPLDPENKYLYHAAIESSEVLNVYSGNAITDAAGEAVVTLPEWFEALNKDPRYQLTVIGTFAQAIIADKVKHNRFTIRTSAPGIEVSWQVTGVRSDAVMLKHPFKAEQDKPEFARGRYLSPEAFGQPEEKGVEWALNPEMMQKRKQRRLEAEEQIRKQQQR